MLPVDHRGTPRCPTCFRRLRPVRWMDAYRCPARTCPLGDPAESRRFRSSYRVTGLELARAGR